MFRKSAKLPVLAGAMIAIFTIPVCLPLPCHPRSTTHDVDKLIQQLDAGNPSVRTKAAAALGELKDARAVNALIIALRDRHAEVRRSAAEALGHIEDPRAVAPLIATLNDTSAEVREWATLALGWIRDTRAVAALAIALKDKDWNVRSSAALSLGWMKDVSAVEPLIVALDDRNPTVRAWAASSLGQIGDPRAVTPLIARLGQKGPGVTENTFTAQVADALAEIDDGRVGEALLAALKSKKLEVVAGAHRFFIRRGIKGSEPTLVEALRSHGTITMAEAYLNCGNGALRAAARQWIQARPYLQVWSRPGPNQLLWGADGN